MDPVDRLLATLGLGAAAGWASGQLLVELAAMAVERLRRRRRLV